MANNEEKNEPGTIRLRTGDGPDEGGTGGIKSLDQSGSDSGGGEFFLKRQIKLFPPDNLDRAVFCRNLSTLIEVGIPLLQALRMLGKRTEHPKLAGAIDKVASRVEEGQSISQGMSEQEKVFSPLVVSIVKVGEVGGILEGSLARLADIMETKVMITRKVRSATMYPTITLMIAFAVIVVVLTKAVPVFADVYKEAQHELPQITQIVLSVSGFLTGYWLLWIPAVVGSIFGYLFFITTPPGKEFTSQLGLRFPGIGRIAQKIAVARFSRTLSSLLTAGIPLDQSISITAETNENTVVRRSLKKVQGTVEQGNRMAIQLASEGIFPNMVVDMIAIGEETGTLDRMLDKISDIYEADVEADLDGISSIIEPVLIVLLGIVVLIIALSVMLPYFNLVKVI